MAPLYARLTGDPWRNQVTRVGHESVESRLETWNGAILTVLYRDGTYQVYTGEKNDPRTLVASGNVNSGAMTRPRSRPHKVES
jgi:hypothetical protein